MELPNYSKQLLQQLQMLRKDGHFCDCTFLVGATTHPAHKAVLAASSMLFKSLFEGSDSISIDTAVLSEREFSSLLDMVYTGRLPPGKHNLTRVIAAADSLQMFDVAVSCKNILDDLLKRTQGQPQETLASGHVSGVPQISLPGELERSGKRADCASKDKAAVELLSQRQDELMKVLQNIQPWIKILQTWEKVAVEQRQMLLECFDGNPGADVIFERILDHVTNRRLTAQTFIVVLDQFQGLKSDLESVLMEQREPEPKGETVSDVTMSSEHVENNAAKLTDISAAGDASELLKCAVEKCSNEALKEVLLQCVQEKSRPEMLERLLGAVSEREMQVQFLQALLQEIQHKDVNMIEEPEDTGGKRTDDCTGVSLLRKFQNRLCELDVSPDVIKQMMEEIPSISSDQRQRVQTLLEEGGGAGGINNLLKAALEGTESPVHTLTVWRVLLRTATQNPDLDRIMQEIKEAPEAQSLIQTAALVEVLYKHRDQISETIREFTEKSTNGLELDDSAGIREFLRSCGDCDGGVESMQQVLERVMSKDLHLIKPLCCLLTRSCRNFPQLSALSEDLSRAEPGLRPTAVPTKTTGNEEDEEEEEEEDGGATRRKRTRRKAVVVSYSCQWCDKTFDFKCRLMRHRKNCALSPKNMQRCSQCPLQFTSGTELQQHQAQEHQNHTDPPEKKKSRPAVCELCQRSFKHPSGLLYHRRTEHLDERPFSCEECGAKFAASSSLKNHMRLHTGEKPYSCKHCHMSFSVAAALSYHTKKKHSEGKMYLCQYCSATFAQSIELTRHVRTHTGDKPYVCRKCGRGFKQANGLSVHLQSFHNVTEPHDCQKCRVSFSCLEELRQHIQELHPKELHQCPECSKILSSATLLEKHMSVHDGSKPYSCKSCQKSYQTLSGLWYHNRTTHPNVAVVSGSRPVSALLRCSSCNKAFCSRRSLNTHQQTEHPDVQTVPDEKEMQTDGSVLWRCVYCGSCHGDQQQLQQHVCALHVSQQGAVLVCVLCSLSFCSEPDFQHHFLSCHLNPAQQQGEELQTQDPASATASTSAPAPAPHMVIQTEEASADGAEPMVTLDQSQLADSQQVFVALADSVEASGASGIVAVNMEDFLAGNITLICEENP